MQRYLL